jgi:phage terminase large subunit-like protein
VATELWVPDNFDWERITALSHTGVRYSSDYRRAIAATDPLVFALLYFIDHLQSPETKGRVSLNDFHIEIADAAKAWIRQDFLPMELRECWVAPRGVGKSTWMFLILPVWAAAYGWRGFISMFADSGGQAQQHLDNIRLEFERNDLLRKDFPGLVNPRPMKGGDNKKEYLSKSGITITAHGIDASTLGAKSGNRRPDLLVFDDIEPHEAKYSAELVQKRLATIINGVFAMNPNAVVQIAGTTTMYGSIIHQLVRSVVSDEAAELFPWIRAENIRTRYFPAIVTNPDGTERSLWPERWSLEWLNSIRGTKSFQMNYMNNPTAAAVDADVNTDVSTASGGFWEESDFVYVKDVDWDPVPTDMVLVIDPATTSKSTSDQSGIAVVSFDRLKQWAIVEYARGVRMKPKALREFVLEVLQFNPMISTVLIETNQGGDYVLEGLQPLPRGIAVINVKEHAPKRLRIRQFLDYDERSWVAYRERFPALHEQQLMYPNVLHDDIVDAVAKGVHHVLSHRIPELTGGRLSPEERRSR